MARAGTGHGLIAWFDSTLAEGIQFSNAPDAPELIFGSAYLPWPGPIHLAAGDHVSVVLQADLIGEDYTWFWNTHVLDQGNPGQVKAHCEQSTFYAVPLSPAQLEERAATHGPRRDEDAELDLLILGMMEGDTPLSEIASRIAAQFPKRFPRWQDALAKVTDSSVTYSR